MLAFCADLEDAIQQYESQTPDQRRISRLEARLDKALPKIIEAVNKLERRIHRLECAFGASPRLHQPGALQALQMVEGEEISREGE
jgi:hypothetical protein